MTIPSPGPFDFISAATSYGWVELAPTAWIDTEKTVTRPEKLESGNYALCEAKADSRGILLTITHRHHELTQDEKNELQYKFCKIFRLDENFTEFYDLCRVNFKSNSQSLVGKGHLMRCPTVFEDLVKTICTTNTTWSGTKRMIHNIVTNFGDKIPFGSNIFTFPNAHRIANIDSTELSSLTGLGYRAQYIVELAKNFSNGTLSESIFTEIKNDTALLKKLLLSIKGVGPYAASTMLMLLGNYCDLAIDSEMKSFVHKKYYPNKTSIKRADIEKVYSHWGNWKYLAYWFDRI